MTTRNRGRKGNSTQERALQPLAGPNASAPKVGGKPTESPSTSASLNQVLCKPLAAQPVAAYTVPTVYCLGAESGAWVHYWLLLL